MWGPVLTWGESLITGEEWLSFFDGHFYCYTGQIDITSCCLGNIIDKIPGRRCCYMHITYRWVKNYLTLQNGN